MDASSYFAPTSGFGRYFRSAPDAPRRIGVIGLGAGAMAAHARAGDNFRQLMEFQTERALGYYRDAFAALPAGDRKTQRPGMVMAAIYQTVLAEIRADGMQVLTQRTSLTPLRKLWIAWRTWVKG